MIGAFDGDVGDRFPKIELNVLVQNVIMTTDKDAAIERLRPELPGLTPEEIARQRQRQELILSRQRVLQQLEIAMSPRHREILHHSLADLDARRRKPKRWQLRSETQVPAAPGSDKPSASCAELIVLVVS